MQTPARKEKLRRAPWLPRGGFGIRTETSRPCHGPAVSLVREGKDLVQRDLAAQALELRTPIALGGEPRELRGRLSGRIDHVSSQARPLDCPVNVPISLKEQSEAKSIS